VHRIVLSYLQNTQTFKVDPFKKQNENKWEVDTGKTNTIPNFLMFMMPQNENIDIVEI